jgi:hypothetical protein
MKAKGTADFSLFLTVIGLFLTSIVFASAASAFSQDTVFPKKRSKKNHGAVYIDTSSSSPYYSRFEYWQPDSLVVSQSQASVSTIMSDGFHHFQNQLRTITGEWIEVNKYRSKFYLYSPCDGIFDARMILSDSALLYFNGENDYSFFPITAVKSLKRGLIQLKLNAPLSDSGGIKSFTTTIRTADDPNRPTEFVSSLEEDSSQMIPVEIVRRYPIIVNDCPDQKEPEVEFDGKGGIKIP